MATVTLPLKGSLPRTCIVCGSPNAKTQRVTMPPSVTPRFGIPLAHRGGYSVIRMSLPLCRTHQGQFVPQVVLRYLLVLGTVGSVVVFLLLAMLLSQERIAFVGFAFALATPVAYFIASARVNRTRVHPIGYDPDRSITLDNVSPEFVRTFAGEEDDEDLPSPPAHFVPPLDPSKLRPSRPATDRGPGPVRTRRREVRDEIDYESVGRGSGSTALWVFGGCAAAFFVAFAGVVLLMVMGWSARKYSGPVKKNRPVVRDDNGLPVPLDEKKPRPQKITLADLTKLKSDPLPIDAGWDEAAMESVPLSDLPEFDVVHGWGKFGKGGMLGYLAWSPNPTTGNDPILVKGKRYPKGISFNAPDESVGRVRYRLGGDQKLLRGMVALNDMPPRAGVKETEKPGIFAVLGDGRLLWKSRPIHRIGDSEAFRISVAGVKELELRVYKPGTKGHGLTVWPELDALK